MELIKKNFSCFLMLFVLLFSSTLKAEEEEILLQSVTDQIQVLTKDLKTLENMNELCS